MSLKDNNPVMRERGREREREGEREREREGEREEKIINRSIPSRDKGKMKN
jgi:hypothetical protein